MAEVGEPLQSGTRRLTVRVVELAAIQNPELVGNAEWELRIWANGLERWNTDAPLRLKEGETVAIGDQFHVDLHDTTDEVSIEVKAVEKDLLRPDDHAEGSAVLYRVQGFSSVPGQVVEIRGRNADLELRLEVDLEG